MPRLQLSPRPAPGGRRRGRARAAPRGQPSSSGRTPGTGNSGAAQILAKLQRARDSTQAAAEQRTKTATPLGRYITSIQKPTEVASLPYSSAGQAASGRQISRQRVSPAPLDYAPTAPPHPCWRAEPSVFLKSSVH